MRLFVIASGFLCSVMLTVACGALASAQENSEAIQAVTLFLKTKSSSTARPIEIAAKEITDVLSKRAHIVVRYPTAPREIVPPEGLAANNVFVVVGKEIESRLSTIEELNGYLKKSISQESKAGREAAVGCWLLLARELFQDGLYEFGEPKIQEVQPNVFEGEVSAKPGKRGRDSGQIKVKVEFEGSSIKGITSSSTLSVGKKAR